MNMHYTILSFMITKIPMNVSYLPFQLLNFNDRPTRLH